MGNADWFKDAVIYQLHVKAFSDSNGDGIGDFRGLLQRINYVAKLGVTAIWLLPFYPSPLRDDGYDIADYFNIHPAYGTLADFKAVLAAAHNAGLRVITELVLNHTSDQHPWFERARSAPAGSSERDFYVWSDTPDRYTDARIIFKDFETSNWTWDRMAGAYYWHRFYSHQPDLNFDNPAVHDALFEVIDFWLEMGVDGLRLDAVPYLYEREGTNCENLPETHAFLRKLRKHIDDRFPNRMLLAEANQWPEDAAAYFGNGDECHMEFHFPLMPRMFMAIQMEDRFPIIDILEQTPEIPPSCQWATFLRNHDELTLEMVTDEERDYMYRVYAEDPRARINLGIRRRLAPLMGNSRRRIELIHSLLFSLPGTPIVYYGDELGMGDNFYLGDRNGVRTPMQWSPDRNGGFSRANPQQLYLPVIIDPEYHYESVNVETQERNLSSLFWWVRRLISIRRNSLALGHGSVEFLKPANPRVLAYLRRHEDDVILAVANLSRFAQSVELDLSAHVGRVPVELFSRTAWPAIEQGLRSFTLGPHDFLWFSLRLSNEGTTIQSSTVPICEMATLPDSVNGELLEQLEKVLLPPFLSGVRWFGGKNRSIRELSIVHDIPLDGAECPAHLLVIQVVFVDGGTERYQLAIRLAKGAAAAQFLQTSPNGLIGRLVSPTGEECLVFDAVFDPAARTALLGLIGENGQIAEGDLSIVGESGKLQQTDLTELPTSVGGAEQSNTAILAGNRFFLKLYRRLEDGVNPDVELTQYLTEKKGFENAPPYCGRLVLRYGPRESVIGMLVGFTENQGDGWTYTLDALARFSERVLAAPSRAYDPELATDLIGGVYPERVRQLANRTAEMHQALSGTESAYAPEPFSSLYQRSLYQALRSALRRLVESLGRVEATLNEADRQLARTIVSAEPALISKHERIIKQRLDASKIRIHGDYHLGQVLNTGKDFVIIDFEGEPRRSLSERRLKRSPLVDVAGMLRSFDYAAESALRSLPPEDVAVLRPWLRVWTEQVSLIFRQEYRERMLTSQLVPRDMAGFDALLESFLLDKAVYEVGYELTYRPHMIGIPLKAIAQFVTQAG